MQDLRVWTLTIKLATSVSAKKAIWMTKIRSDIILILTLLHDQVALFDNIKCPFISPQPCSTKKNHIWLSVKIYIAAVDWKWSKKSNKKEEKEANTLVRFCCVLANKHCFFVCFFKKAISTNFCICTHLGQMLQQCQHIQVNKGK